MKPSLILISIFYFVSNIFSQTNTWTGAVDNDWHKSCNWSLNLIPTCLHDVVIPNATNSPVVTAIAHSKTIDIQSSTGGHLEIISSGGGIVYVSSLNSGVCSGTATDNSALGCCTGWVQTNNLSNPIQSIPNSEKEEAYGVTSDGTNLYIVGDRHSARLNNPNSDWSIEKRLISDGSLVSGFGTGGVVSGHTDGFIDVPFNVVYDATGIYVAGIQHLGTNYFGPQKWRIQKFNATTGASIWVQQPTWGTGNEYAYDIAINSTGVYTAGYDFISSSDYRWRITKHNAAGTQQWSVFNNHTTAIDVAYGIAADETDVYVVGTSTPSSDARWIIEKRSAATGALVAGFGTSGVVTYNPYVGSGTIDYAHDVAVDATGVYVVGVVSALVTPYQYAIRKYNKTNGSLIWETISTMGTNFRDFRISVDATGAYVSGNWSTWTMHKYDLSTGNAICTKTSTMTSPAANNIIATPAGVFMVGKDNTASNERWRMEKMCCE